MGVKAKWGPKSFLTSPQAIIPFDSFSTSVSLKADSENDTSGTDPTNTRGRELQPFSCSTTYYAAAGSDPMAEYNSWVDLLGLHHPLYVGDRRLGPAESFMLQGINVDEMLQADSGAVLSITLSFSFTEYSEGKSSKLSNVKGDSSAAQKAKSTYDATVAAKKSAKNATASSADRNNKKLSPNVEVRAW